ncbi:MAG TPA: adenylate/guanylate cyclase domain-containing protein, partial [Magnetospirillaceae bacterium]|nr:adenylate/guanylate cyclase domain-containing protein [Magnetospirillaceae bacterium]
GHTFPVDMASFFIWTVSFYVGLLQAWSGMVRRSWPKRVLEAFLSFGTVFTFIFFYFYLVLRISLITRFNAGELPYDGYLRSLSITSFPSAFGAFIRSPQHSFFAFGAFVFGILQLVNKVKELSLRTRLERVLASVPPPTADAEARSRITAAENKEAAVIYGDIWNFSAITGKVSARESVAVLNRYYSLWNVMVTRHGGYMDQFVGDTAVAVFGLLGEKDAGERAVACAFELLRELPHLQDDLAAAGLPVFKHVGVGVHSGKVTVGELNNNTSPVLSVFGEAVSIAARLDSLCREFKQDILVSQAVYKQVSLETQQRLQFVGEVLLRGRTSPSAVYGRK